MVTQRLRVAVAEDDDDQRIALESALEAEGFEVLSFEDGSELLDYFQMGKAQWPDAIISDVNMPGHNGLEALELARRRGIHAPIFVVTGNTQPGIRAQVLRLGNALLIPKPVEVDRLANAIFQLTGRPAELAKE